MINYILFHVNFYLNVIFFKWHDYDFWFKFILLIKNKIGVKLHFKSHSLKTIHYKYIYIYIYIYIDTIYNIHSSIYNFL